MAAPSGEVKGPATSCVQKGEGVRSAPADGDASLEQRRSVGLTA